MTRNWFECKVRYEKTAENGMVKKVTEPYLVDALSFTEAEARIIEEITPFISGEFQVTAIKRANYSGMFTDEDGDKWFKCKLQFITIDEKTATEKKTPTSVLVQANNIDEAKATLDFEMKGAMCDYSVESVIETKIMDVYPYCSKDVKEEFPQEVEE